MKLTAKHRNKISKGLIEYHKKRLKKSRKKDRSIPPGKKPHMLVTSKIGYYADGTKMSDRKTLRQKKAVLIQLVNKVKLGKGTKKDETEAKKLGKDIRALNLKLGLTKK